MLTLAAIRKTLLGLENFTGVRLPRPPNGQSGSSVWRRPSAGLEQRTLEEQVDTNLRRWLFCLTQRFVSMGLGFRRPFNPRGHELHFRFGPCFKSNNYANYSPNNTLGFLLLLWSEETQLGHHSAPIM